MYLFVQRWFFSCDEQALYYFPSVKVLVSLKITSHLCLRFGFVAKCRAGSEWCLVFALNLHKIHEVLCIFGYVELRLPRLFRFQREFEIELV